MEDLVKQLETYKEMLKNTENQKHAKTLELQIEALEGAIAFEERCETEDMPAEEDSWEEETEEESG